MKESIKATVVCRRVEFDANSQKQGSIYLTAIPDKYGQYKDYFDSYPEVEIKVSGLKSSVLEKVNVDQVYCLSLEVID